MIDATKELPEMFTPVIVFGCIEKLNVLPQMWEARRWTGCTSGFDVEKDKLWGWYTPTDMRVNNVTRWIPMPERGGDK